MSDRLNATTKCVATHRLESLEWGPFEGLGPDIVTDIRRIKLHNGPDLILSGSSTLTSALREHGLADEVDLLVYPVLLGKGKRLFAEATPPRAFELVSTKTLSSGIVINAYEAAGPLKTNHREQLVEGHRSTSAFNRPSVSSHCAEIISRCCRRSSNRFRSNCQTLCRPWAKPRTKPALSITRRCLVMACRVIGSPTVSFAIDSGPSPARRDTSRSRVSSPSAAKTNADSPRSGFVLALRSLGKVPLDQRRDDRPAFVVRGKCARAPLDRDVVESRLADGEHDPARWTPRKRAPDANGRSNLTPNHC